MRVARTWRLSLLSVVAVVSAQLAPMAGAHATNPPTVSVTTPGGTVVEGPGSISGTGIVDSGDTAVSMQLLVDDQLVGTAQACGVAQGDPCPITIAHDFSGLSGSHLVAFRFVTSDMATSTVTSTDVGINVTYVPPTVSVTSPTVGATVTGNTSITVSGSTDPGQTDWPVSLALSVGGALYSTFTCPGQDTAHRSCTNTFSYDFTGMTGSQQVTAHMVTHLDSADSPAPYAVNPSNPAPVVSITSPGSGSTQSGTVAIAATGMVNTSLSDNASQLQLFVDGTQYGTSYSCPVAKSCSHTFNWDGTGRTDTASVLVKLLTTRGVLQPSPAIGLNMVTPAPTVSITSPTAGGAVSGTVPVAVTAAVGTGQTDNAASLQLLIDGTPYLSPTSCTAAATCTKTISWDTTGVSGPHTIAAKFVTTGAKTVTTTPITVTVSSPGPSASVLSPSSGTAVQGIVSVTGFGAVNPSQSDTPATMQLYVDNAPVGTPAPAVASPDADPKDAQNTFTWDSTGLVGAHSLQVKFTTAGGFSVLSPGITVVVSSPAPVVSVSPLSATVSGVVTLSGTATVDASQTDTPSSLQLLVDGAASGTAVSCPAGGANPKACSATMSWDSTGLTGAHVLQVRVATARGAAALSTGATVTVISPSPTVVITSPTVDSTVSGAVTVTADGTVDASQTDAAGVLQFLVDGTPQSLQIACPAGKDCPASFTWATSGLSGAHTIGASFTTAKGRVIVANERVYVFSGTHVKLNPIAVLPYGHVASVKGTLTATANGKGIGSALVDVTFTPAVGAKHLLTVRTDGLGRFTAALKVAANTAVSVTPRATAYFGPSTTTGKILVTAAISCSAKVTVHQGALAAGVCKVPNLLKGTKVSLQYKVGTHWVTIGSAKAGKAVVSWSARFTRTGTYAVRIVVSASRIFTGSTSAAAKLVVS